MAKQVAKKEKTGTPADPFLEPFGVFRDEMNALFDRFFGHPMSVFDAAPLGAFAKTREMILSPRIDVEETDDEIVMTAELPGIDEKDIALKVEDGVLTLSGEKKSEHEEKNGNRRVQERSYGSFKRTFTLPAAVDEDNIAAAYEKGVLTVTMPKKDEPKAETRQIKIGKKAA